MIQLLLLLAVIGLVTWAIVNFIPMPAGIRSVIVAVAVICCVILALNAFGVHLPNIGVPKLQ